MYIDLRLSEYITIGIEAMNTTITKDVITLTATEDITLHMTIIYLDACTTKLVNGTHNTRFIIIATLSNLTTSDGCNLAATKDAVTNLTAPYRHVCEVHTTVIVVSTTKKIATVRQTVHTDMVGPCLIIQFLFVLAVFRIVGITDVSIVHNQVGCTKDRTTLTTAIGITLDGRYALIVAIAVGQCSLVLTDANDNVCLAKDIRCSFRYFLVMIAYITGPSASIDITRRTAFNIGCR